MPQTPINPQQLLQQVSSIKTSLKWQSNSPPSPIINALEQVFKGCKMVMHNAAFLAKENQDLHTANKKQCIKCQRSTHQVAHEGGLTASEALVVMRE